MRIIEGGRYSFLGEEVTVMDTNQWWSTVRDGAGRQYRITNENLDRLRPRLWRWLLQWPHNAMSDAEALLHGCCWGLICLVVVAAVTASWVLGTAELLRIVGVQP